VVNRRLTTRKSWLGEVPLLHVSPGPRVLHGVPFRILGGREEAGRGAVVLRSRRSRTAGAVALPSSVGVALDGIRAARFFLLHACGWSGPGGTFGRLAFAYGDGTRVEVPLSAVGRGPVIRETCALQDWWPAFSRPALAGTKPWVVTGPDGDPLSYERWLYVHAWRNPRPDVGLVRLEVSTDANALVTYALLAVTALQSADGVDAKARSLP
jgi:hypothetical protein